MVEITDSVEEFISPHIPEEYELVAVEWEKRGADWVLSVLIDKEDAEVSIDETTELSEIISPLLDEMQPDPFPKEGYLLEVASAGAERPLRKLADFQRFIGEYVFVSLYQKVDGQKEFVGDLKAADEADIQIEYADKSRKKLVTIPLNVIAKAQTMVKL